MKRITIAVVLVLMMVGTVKAGDKQVSDITSLDSYVCVIGLDNPIPPKDAKVGYIWDDGRCNIAYSKEKFITTLAKDGSICEIYGHSWCVWVGKKSESFYKHCDEDIDYSKKGERFCAICGKEQKYIKVWKDK